MLPEQGANVYDILRRDVLVLTKNAVEQLQEAEIENLGENMQFVETVARVMEGLSMRLAAL